MVGCVDVWWGVLQVLAHDQVAQRKREVKAAEEDLKRRMKAAKKDHIPFSDEQVRRWDMCTHMYMLMHTYVMRKDCVLHILPILLLLPPNTYAHAHTCAQSCSTAHHSRAHSHRLLKLSSNGHCPDESPPFIR